MASEVENVLRALTMLDKALDRLGRLNYSDRKQYPQIFAIVENTLSETKEWIRRNKSLCSLKRFYISLNELIMNLTNVICELWNECKPNKGKKKSKGLQKQKEIETIYKSIRTILENIMKSITSWDNSNIIGIKLEKSIGIAVNKHIVAKFTDRIKKGVVKGWGTMISETNHRSWNLPMQA